MKNCSPCRVKFFILLGALIAGFSSLFAYNHFTQYRWDQALSLYGFSSSQEKNAFNNLLKRASISIKRPSWNETLSRQKKESLLIHNILTLVQETQAKFTIRTGTQERWDVQALPWMEHNSGEILADLTTLGFVTAIDPQFKSSDAICILGATTPCMAKRLNYVQQLLSQGVTTHQILLLSGERYVTKDVDGPVETLKRVASTYGIKDWSRLTEAHLLQDLYRTSPLSQRDLPVELINTPARDLARPTTQTTIMALIEWLKKHPEVRRVIFVSDQPYVHYQQAIIESILEGAGYPIAFEVVGPAVENLDNSQRLIEALGSYIWAKTPNVLAHLGLILEDIPPSYKKDFQELYAKNPLIYKQLPRALSSL